MATPTTSNLLLDPTGAPIPQLWDPVQSAWYAFATLTTFKIGNAGGNVAGYHFGYQVLAGAGWFKEALGQYKGSVPAWIMVFNINGVPGNVVPDYPTAVAPVIAGQGDNNWNITPIAPVYFSTGIYIAISTTGGKFTATANTDFTGTCEFYQVGT